MDVKVYQKEEVLQPDGIEYVYVPNVIDIIPSIIEPKVVVDYIWQLNTLLATDELRVVNNRLVINSDRITFENGKLYVQQSNEQLISCELVEGKEELEQQCALATIYQKGQDPLDLNYGIRWSEAILEELSCLQLIQDIIDAVEKVSTSVVVTFDMIEGENGQSYLSYKLSEVA